VAGQRRALDKTAELRGVNRFGIPHTGELDVRREGDSQRIVRVDPDRPSVFSNELLKLIRVTDPHVVRRKLLKQETLDDTKAVGHILGLSIRRHFVVA